MLIIIFVAYLLGGGAPGTRNAKLRCAFTARLFYKSTSVGLLTKGPIPLP